MGLLMGNTEDTLESANVYTKQQRIARLAKVSLQTSFTSLAYYIDAEWMREAYHRTRKGGAEGVDGQTAEQYAERLEENLQDLLERAKSGTYKAPPVRRVFIPKGSKQGEVRPIGIPTFEDKVLQRGVQMVLEPLYEQDFLPCSYGFRPGCSAHQALDVIWKEAMRIGGGWVVEVDIRKYFDTLKHSQLHEILKQRVSDGVIRRLIGKWLKAGVMEGRSITYPEEGTPQGGVISPLLSNIYLHTVLDKWFTEEIQPRLSAGSRLIRFADDFLIFFERKADAERVLAVLPKRFARYGLELHPQKTRLINFRIPEEKHGKTIDFLGFTHYWGKSRKGQWVVKRKTARDRLTRAVKKVHQWCRKNRHEAVKEQCVALQRKLNGHYGYYGITGNMQSLSNFFLQTKRAWRKWLDRRSRKPSMPWPRFNDLLKHYQLPYPRIVHSALIAQ
jgi:group II intron reverse transcriptase/maturase